MESCQVTNRVLVVDDHAVLRRGIKSIVNAWPGWEITGETGTGEEAVDLAASLKPDVILMDISMPGMGGLNATKIICNESPQTKIVLLTLHDSMECVRAAFQAGARGYLLKSDTEVEMMRALETVVGNGIYASPRLDQAGLEQLLGELGLKSAGNTQNLNGKAGNAEVTQATSPNA
jgi:DNA-binding NarL/FixJ family response regulator